MERTTVFRLLLLLIYVIPITYACATDDERKWSLLNQYIILVFVSEFVIGYVCGFGMAVMLMLLSLYNIS